MQNSLLLETFTVKIFENEHEYLNIILKSITHRNGKNSLKFNDVFCDIIESSILCQKDDLV